MKPSEIVSLIERIEKSGNKTQALAEAGVNKATYYSWLRRYRRGGIAGLIPKQSKWTDKEIQKLVEAASEAWSVNDILPKYPKRSKKAIEAKLADCGFSFREHQRKLLAARKDKRCRKCGLLKPVEDFYDAAFESLDGKHSYCKQCVLMSQSKYRETNPEKIQSRQ
ncbi:MAG: helix-turn-helix domain-containing protein [Gammaproteobacteria bacterium]|nr:helix-turn-helix domain-containing protein [Gammaproteobacteria bacterium]MDH3480384.1 helix-turn-helix domain-containing protein [Gammaproteobacteria bacterium]